MTEPEEDVLANIRELLDEMDKNPDMAAAAEIRRRSDEMVTNEVRLKLKALNILNFLSIITALAIILIGILGYMRLLYAVPVAIAAFILFKKIGKRVLDAISLSRIRSKSVAMMDD